MRQTAFACAAALAFAGCGLEGLFGNLGHEQYERPASKIVGSPGMVQSIDQLTVIDATGTALEPFQSSFGAGRYELRLPSSKYQMLRVRGLVGNGELRAIVPSIGEESEVPEAVDLDARSMTETLITEARLSADGSSLDRVTPDVYLATRALIREGFDQPGPTQDLLHMVERFMGKIDPSIGATDPDFFRVPEYDETFKVVTSAIDAGWISRNPFDFAGDDVVRFSSDLFDEKLGEVAQLYRPGGCPDPNRIRLVFTVDFNEGAKNGLCAAVNRFLWASNKPGKSMFFVGWIYDGTPGQTPSDITDPNVAKLLGNSTPNTIPMYDDGTNGDQTAGDNIWSIYFDVPRSSPGSVLRIGYKYTWGTTGAGWSGSEEWPGNSRLLEVVDDNGDDFVYRRDVFGDEATNKDKANARSGTLTWTTDVEGCGTPTTHENEYDNNACSCGEVATPDWLGPLTVACTQ